MTRTPGARAALPMWAAAAAALLSGCAVMQPPCHCPQDRSQAMPAAAATPAHSGKPDPANPRVWVHKGRITVDQEPVRFFNGEGEVKITWRLDPRSPYTFPEDGITVDKADALAPPPGSRAAPRPPQNHRDEFKCRRDQNPKVFICMNHNRGPGQYKYTIRVMDGDKPVGELDPVIVNDW